MESPWQIDDMKTPDTGINNFHNIMYACAILYAPKSTRGPVC